MGNAVQYEATVCVVQESMEGRPLMARGQKPMNRIRDMVGDWSDNWVAISQEQQNIDYRTVYDCYTFYYNNTMVDFLQGFVAICI